jgi:hypothetical protein
MSRISRDSDLPGNAVLIQARKKWCLSVLPNAIAALVISLGHLSLAADAPGAAALAAKGIRIKTEKDGTATEVYIPPTAEMTLGDYQAVGKLTTLKVVYSNAKGLPLDDESAPALAHLDHLEKFFANGAELTDDGFKAFAGWKSLKSFGLDHWGWYAPGHLPQKGTLGPGLAHLASCPNLEHVRLGGCRVDNRVTAALARIPSLQSVDLQHTMAVTDEGIAALKAMPKLRIVKLSPQFSPRITDASLVFLGEIRTLEEIEINETWLTYDKGFSHLKNLASLKKLVLAKVVASEADIAKLKADHPAADVQWTPPDDATAAKTKEQFQRFWEKQAKAKP